MLQKSVWVTPYNPHEVLEEFIRERKLKGAVIISSVGKDGSIGEEDIENLVYKVYELDKLSERYRKFLEKYKDKNKDPINGMFAYLSILQDDPQLPFELLPIDWLGDEAYKFYKSLVKKVKRQQKESLSRWAIAYKLRDSF